MAQKVNVVLVDDLDGSKAAETLTFGLDGTTYEIDLNSKHASQLRKTLRPFVDSARQVKMRRRVNGYHRSNGVSTSQRRKEAKAIRQWAAENGWEISSNGPIPRNVRQAYEEAHA